MALAQASSTAPPAPSSEGLQQSTPAPADTTAPPSPPGTPAGTGTLRQPGQVPRDVPLMSIQKDEPRVQVGPISRDTGVADVLLGSLGLVAVAVIAALVLGALLGGVLVFVKHRLGWGGPDRDADDHITLKGN